MTDARTAATDSSTEGATEPTATEATATEATETGAGSSAARAGSPGASALCTDGIRLLRRLVGRADAQFRDGQWEAVEALVSRRQRVLVVQRTGWGKSAVYFVATGLRRAAGWGPTLIVSPLLALMRDQVAAAERAGVRAVTINSANAEEWTEIGAALDADEVDVVLVSPERLNNPRFREERLPDLAARCGLLVVDEAHCISDWGHDFRPDYRRLRDLLTRLPEATPVLATTATANTRVSTDVAEQLAAGGADVLTVRGALARESLRLGVLTLTTPQQRLAWLAAHLEDLPGSGIIYCLTVSAADDIAAHLRASGHRVRSYTGRTDPPERHEAEEALRANEVKALVATSALGMGFDKPDLGFVVHVGAPASPITYYQQVGRAGRSTERADVVLLPGVEDRDIWHYFATTSMPRQEQADAVLRALREAGKPLSTAALEAIADVRRSRLELLLKVLDVDGAVRKVGGGWETTGQPWSYDAERYERIAKAREIEARSMLEYQQTRRCRMRYLQHALDDPAADQPGCGRCDNCAGPWYATEVSEAAHEQAAARLHRAGVSIEPRAMWPSGMDRLGVDVRGKIPAAEQAETGQAVARLTDLGWGGRLRALLAADAADGPVDDTLLAACVEVLKSWDWPRRPDAIVVIPSRRRPMLVRSVADRLSGIGRLPALAALDLLDGGPTGEAGGNSAFRLAGVWGRFMVGSQLRAEIDQLRADSGTDPALLLVDDLVDSRWTATVAARELRAAGAGAVLPFALATAS